MREEVKKFFFYSQILPKGLFEDEGEDEFIVLIDYNLYKIKLIGDKLYKYFQVFQYKNGDWKLIVDPFIDED